MKSIDEKEVAKYVQIINRFIDMSIDVSEFEKAFIELRRKDKYWLSGSINKNLEQILNTLFLDVSDYTPKELCDSNDEISIDEEELYKRVSLAKEKIENILVDG